MKKLIKKSLSVLIVLMLMVCVIPFGSFTASAATITEEAFLAKIEELKKEYPHGKFWNDKNGIVSSGTYRGTSKAGSSKCGSSYYWTDKCGTFALSGNYIAWQCHGFSLLLGHKIFGSNANNWDKYTSKNRQIYAGDVIRIDMDGDGVNDDYDHTIFVYKVTSTDIYYADCNKTGPCKINWNGKMKLTELKKKLLYVRHKSGNTLTGNGSINHNLTIQYNANGGVVSGDTHFLNSGTVYYTSTNKVRSHTWKYGSGDSDYGLTNYTTLDLTKIGHTFKGWCLNSDGSGRIFDQDDTSLKAEDIYPNVKNGDATVTLYAIWKPNKVVIKYNANGASIADNVYTVTTDGNVGLWLRSSHSTSSDKLICIPDETQLTVFETKTTGGYTWGKTTYNGKTGWAAISEGAVKKYYMDSGVVCLTTAKEARTNTWSYGSGDREYGLVNYTTLTLSKNGYNFAGWCLNSDGSGRIFDQDDTSLKAEDIYPNVKNGDANVTLYAIWKPVVKTVKSIEIATKPNKTEYKVGETLDAAGLKLKVNYDDSSSEIVTSGFDIYGFDTSTSGIKTLTVSYGGKTTTYNIIIKDRNKKGDVDCDGAVNIADATVIQKHLAQTNVLDDLKLRLADVNGDGVVNIADATRIQKFLASIIDKL